MYKYVKHGLILALALCMRTICASSQTTTRKIQQNICHRNKFLRIHEQKVHRTTAKNNGDPMQWIIVLCVCLCTILLSMWKNSKQQIVLCDFEFLNHFHRRNWANAGSLTTTIATCWLLPTPSCLYRFEQRYSAATLTTSAAHYYRVIF